MCSGNDVTGSAVLLGTASSCEHSLGNIGKVK
jgi:hypothetical protein